ncbi:MAG: sensor histidine kinase [Promethearchaeia archaeon]
MVLDNLFRNAAQHAGSEPHVDVLIGRSGNSITIDCVDNGPGVPPEQQENLFKRGTNQDVGGLGLYLCKRLVEAFDGSLELVQEEYPNAGAAFRIRFQTRN